jgi:aspartate ammonia-lyase
MSTEPTRLEHDLLGEKAIPAAAYYGVQTARALENFHIRASSCASIPS